ncbi:MAG: hypothetical protein U5J98_01120 [Halobacteriales archaeon]|nr:hypothetical protein [Halobacteriales archaeon]
MRLHRDAERGFADRPESGPSVVSTATLESVASWFDTLNVEDVRRRLRANVEVAGVPAFWEDRFVGAGAPAFVIDGPDGDVRVEGVEPCGRCVVPDAGPRHGRAPRRLPGAVHRTPRRDLPGLGRPRGLRPRLHPDADRPGPRGRPGPSAGGRRRGPGRRGLTPATETDFPPSGEPTTARG